MRKHSVDQMKRIEREIVKQGGTLDRTSPSEKNFANKLYIHDPFDADSKGKRKIATAEEFFKNDIPDAKTSVKMKNENISESEDFNFEELLNEEKEDIFKYLSNNFQKLTKEIKKLQDNDQHIINELNNVVKLNNLKR